jgi:hypothetical protein
MKPKIGWAVGFGIALVLGALALGLDWRPAGRGEVVKTLIPTQAGGLRPDARPQPPFITLQTRSGQELVLSSFRLEPNSYVAYHTESLAQGLPLSSGVELAFDFLEQVELGAPPPEWWGVEQPGASLRNPAGELVLPEPALKAGEWPVTLTLSDGRVVETRLGFKAQHLLHLTGQSENGYGPLDLPLSEVLNIHFVRRGPGRPVPAQPQGGPLFTVETLTGEKTVVADPVFFARCMYDVFCCREESLRAVPLAGGADLGLEQLKQVLFTGEGQAQGTRLDGRQASGRVRDCPACPGTGWRVRGKTALGDFEIMLDLVKSLHREE